MKVFCIFLSLVITISCQDLGAQKKGTAGILLSNGGSRLGKMFGQTQSNLNRRGRNIITDNPIRKKIDDKIQGRIEDIINSEIKNAKSKIGEKVKRVGKNLKSGSAALDLKNRQPYRKSTQIKRMGKTIDQKNILDRRNEMLKMYQNRRQGKKVNLSQASPTKKIDRAIGLKSSKSINRKGKNIPLLPNIGKSNTPARNKKNKNVNKANNLKAIKRQGKNLINPIKGSNSKLRQSFGKSKRFLRIPSRTGKNLKSGNFGLLKRKGKGNQMMTMQGQILRNRRKGKELEQKIMQNPISKKTTNNNRNKNMKIHKRKSKNIKSSLTGKLPKPKQIGKKMQRKMKTKNIDDRRNGKYIKRHINLTSNVRKNKKSEKNKENPKKMRVGRNIRNKKMNVLGRNNNKKAARYSIHKRNKRSPFLEKNEDNKPVGQHPVGASRGAWDSLIVFDQFGVDPKRLRRKPKSQVAKLIESKEGKIGFATFAESLYKQIDAMGSEKQKLSKEVLKLLDKIRWKLSRETRVPLDRCLIEENALSCIADAGDGPVTPKEMLIPIDDDLKTVTETPNKESAEDSDKMYALSDGELMNLAWPSNEETSETPLTKPPNETSDPIVEDQSLNEIHDVNIEIDEIIPDSLSDLQIKETPISPKEAPILGDEYENPMEAPNTEAVNPITEGLRDAPNAKDKTVYEIQNSNEDIITQVPEPDSISSIENKKPIMDESYKNFNEYENTNEPLATVDILDNYSSQLNDYDSSIDQTSTAEGILDDDTLIDNLVNEVEGIFLETLKSRLGQYFSDAELDVKYTSQNGIVDPIDQNQEPIVYSINYFAPDRFLANIEKPAKSLVGKHNIEIVDDKLVERNYLTSEKRPPIDNAITDYPSHLMSDETEKAKLDNNIGKDDEFLKKENILELNMGFDDESLLSNNNAEEGDNMELNSEYLVNDDGLLFRSPLLPVGDNISNGTLENQNNSDDNVPTIDYNLLADYSYSADYYPQADYVSLPDYLSSDDYGPSADYIPLADFNPSSDFISSADYKIPSDYVSSLDYNINDLVDEVKDLVNNVVASHIADYVPSIDSNQADDKIPSDDNNILNDKEALAEEQLTSNINSVYDLSPVAYYDSSSEFGAGEDYLTEGDYLNKLYSETEESRAADNLLTQDSKSDSDSLLSNDNKILVENTIDNIPLSDVLSKEHTSLTDMVTLTDQELSLDSEVASDYMLAGYTPYADYYNYLSDYYALGDILPAYYDDLLDGNIEGNSQNINNINENINTDHIKQAAVRPLAEISYPNEGIPLFGKPKIPGMVMETEISPINQELVQDKVEDSQHETPNNIPSKEFRGQDSAAPRFDDHSKSNAEDPLLQEALDTSYYDSYPNMASETIVPNELLQPQNYLEYDDQLMKVVEPRLFEDNVSEHSIGLRSEGGQIVDKINY